MRVKIPDVRQYFFCGGPGSGTETRSYGDCTDIWFVRIGAKWVRTRSYGQLVSTDWYKVGPHGNYVRTRSHEVVGASSYEQYEVRADPHQFVRNRADSVRADYQDEARQNCKN